MSRYRVDRATAQELVKIVGQDLSRGTQGGHSIPPDTQAIFSPEIYDLFHFIVVNNSAFATVRRKSIVIKYAHKTNNSMKKVLVFFPIQTFQCVISMSIEVIG